MRIYFIKRMLYWIAGLTVNQKSIASWSRCKTIGLLLSSGRPSDPQSVTSY